MNPNSSPIPASRPGPPPAGPPPSAASAVNIDPIKLLLRYKWVLGGSVVFGLFLGLAAHYTLMLTYPIYKPTALFVCNAPERNLNELTGTSGVVSQEELQTFMQTQARLMVSDEVLDKVANDTRLEAEAPRWIKGYIYDGKVDPAEVFKELQDEVKARVVPQTSIIELSFGWKRKEDAAGIVNLVQETYMDLVRRNSRSLYEFRIDALRTGLKGIGDDLTAAKRRREALIKEKNIDIANQGASAASNELSLLNKSIVDSITRTQQLQTELDAREEQLNSPSGDINYGEQLKSKVNQNLELVDLRRTISAIESELDSLRIAGVRSEHREYKQLASRLEASESQVSQLEAKLLDQEFRAELEQLRLAIASERNASQQLISRRETLLREQNEKLQAITEIQDIDQRVQSLMQEQTRANEELKNLVGVTSLPTALRVVPQQSRVRLPKEPTFPRLVFMIPAGAILCLGAVAAFVVIKEVVDQRIKGPSDVTVIPRTRLLGWVADATEDPAGPGAVETAFRDRPRGLLAENFRQVRSALLKRLENAGHRTVVVMGGMPGSGASSIASNLALAAAGANQNVLIIDANLRRAAMHRVFGVQEKPGLADVLSGDVSLDTAAVSTPGSTVKVLPAGTRERRVYELLSTDVFSKLLQEARSKFDLVLIDVSPAVVSTDGQSVANRCDASVLVVRAFSERRGMLARIKNELSEARAEFLGVIVNGVKSSAGGYLKKNIQATHEYHSEEAAA